VLGIEEELHGGRIVLVDLHAGDLADAASVDRAIAAASARARSLGGRLRVIHSGAVISYRTRDGELQRRDNVEGTRHLLELCGRCDIRQFHHVSTAYVCGYREDRVREDEVDVGQQNCNPYEATKLQAEKLVRGSDFLDRVTVYRPSSVLGDSVTGYTSTTHGFYLPLQLAYNSRHRFPVSFMDDRFMKFLGLQGHERQNLGDVARVLGQCCRHCCPRHLPAATVGLIDVLAIARHRDRDVGISADGPMRGLHQSLCAIGFAF